MLITVVDERKAIFDYLACKRVDVEYNTADGCAGSFAKI